MPGQESLSKKLVDATFADTVFFTNSGAEAMECAIKMARRYHYVTGHPERFHIITFEGAFHGRTLATIAAGGQEKYLEGFGPKVEGFDQVQHVDLKAVEGAISREDRGDPDRADPGRRRRARAVPTEFLRRLRKLCDERGLLLIFDEIQTGVGRTGKFFAYEWSDVKPDIMAIAKGIGGGYPMGACLATAEAAKGMTMGTHGTTFGGNPLGMAVGNKVLDIVLAPGFLEHVRHVANYFRQQLGAADRRTSGRVRRTARRRPDAGPQDESAEHRVRGAPARARHAGGRRGRQCRAPAAAADRRRNAYPRSHDALERSRAGFRGRQENGGGMNAPTRTAVSPKHFLDIADLDGATLKALIAEARRRKEARKDLPKGALDADAPLAGRVLAMIFDKHSTRTRISFDVGMRQLGGGAIMMTGSEMQLAREETIADTARVLSRYVDAVMIRLLDHEMVRDLADNATIPVINGLTKLSHPCQVMADVMTFEERFGSIKGKTIAWSGDANNVLTSWVHAAGRLGFHAARWRRPPELSPSQSLARLGQRRGRRCAVRRGSREGRQGRAMRDQRRLGFDGRRRRHQAPQHAEALSGE